MYTCYSFACCESPAACTQALNKRSWLSRFTSIMLLPPEPTGLHGSARCRREWRSRATLPALAQSTLLGQKDNPPGLLPVTSHHESLRRSREGERIPPPQGWTTNNTFQASSKSGLKQEAAAQGRVPSGLPGHPAAPNWTLDGRVAATGHQPRTPIPRGRSRHRQRHGPHLPAGPAGRRLGGAAQAPRESERARGHRLGSLRCRGVDGSLSCSPELPERVETAFNPS